HFFFFLSDISDLQILSLVELSLDQDNPRDWYYALMDYGAYIKSTLGNQNKRSKHYSKQSKFEGSKRQLRGEILRLLSEKNSLLIKDVYTVSKRTKKETAEIIADLMKEGFIEEIEGKFYLVKS
ncbi:A/G-specific adenine glycosylase, partial [Candidatus Dojkabacteria bacterium]|nr:A/G-specific adenine glycosylase [Candidatus Dojkabacteria bacterium]